MVRFLALVMLASSSLTFACGEPGSPTNGCLPVGFRDCVGQECSSPPLEPYRDGNEIYEVSDRTQKMAEAYGQEIRDGRLRERTNIALDAIIRFAALKLRLKGNKQKADELIQEWESRWSGYIMRVGRDLGDHRPLSQWLAEKYAMIEFVLGETLCHTLRLDDIKIINYGIPVVFSCVDNVNEVEFEKHFVPLSGTVVYWSSFIACTGGTWGSGFLFCSPISWGCEFVTEQWVAPKLNSTVWNWSCN